MSKRRAGLEIANVEGPEVPPTAAASQDVQLSGASSGRKTRHAAYAAAVFVLVLAVAWALYSRAFVRPSVNAATPSVATVTRGRFIEDITGEGSIVAVVRPTLFAVANGTVTYRVHAGDKVKKAQVLAVLDSPDLVGEYRRERDTLEGLDVALRRLRVEDRLQILATKHDAALMQLASRAADQELNRQKAAWALRVVPERDYRKALYDSQAAELNASHAAAAAPLQRENIALEFRAKSIERDREALVVQELARRVEALTLRSPVDGIAGNLAQADRAKVRENAPLLTVVDLGRLDVEFKVRESYATNLRSGAPAEVVIDGVEHAGRVTTISPVVSNYEVSGRIEFLSPPSAGLRQGERVSVRLVLNDLPNALKFERGPGIDEKTSAVYVIRGNRAMRTPVTLGAVSTSEAQVLRGLAAGDRVVISDTSAFSGAAEVNLSR